MSKVSVVVTHPLSVPSSPDRVTTTETLSLSPPAAETSVVVFVEVEDEGMGGEITAT